MSFNKFVEGYIINTKNYILKLKKKTHKKHIYKIITTYTFVIICQRIYLIEKRNITFI